MNPPIVICGWWENFRCDTHPSLLICFHRVDSGKEQLLPSVVYARVTLQIILDNPDVVVTQRIQLS